ncbi:MAG TPA: sigma 54-interacting transcriptional regulator [Thermodesulfobacteriota bacterium]|nr:sigma 54-interacting transcriptional regulator [Thermodesulfobacteriota bacterium]
MKEPLPRKWLSTHAKVTGGSSLKKSTETMHAEVEERLSLVPDSAKAHLWDLEIDSGRIRTTEKANEFFGFAPDRELDLESFLNMVHPEDREKLRLTLEEAVRSGEDNGAEYRIVRPDGSIRWVLSRARPYPASPEQPARLIGVSIDMTVRKQVEQALENRLRFERLLSDLSARFINIPPDRVDSEIDYGLRQILEFFQVDRAGLMRSLPDRSGHQITHGVYGEDVPSVPVGVELPRSLYPWASEKLAEKHEVVYFSKLDDLPPEANVDRQTYAKWGIRSVLDIPIITGGSAVHVIAINSVKNERVWPEELFPRLQLLGEIFVNALERKQIRLELEQRLRQIQELKQRLEKENLYLHQEVKLLADHTEIVRQSLAMKKVLSQAEQVAQTDSTVLIQGETGTGKELVARAIHRLSSRRDRLLVTINCASLPPTLIESELFGREKGAYTGALTKMIGRFEVADGSTLFFDEIGEIPLELQSKLLRVLEEGSFERLGSTNTLHVNVRIIAATNRDLGEEVKAGRFRKDLYYRLNVFPIAIPPLRERPEDIPLLVWAFVRMFQERMGKEIETISKKTMEVLQSYSWPGNVRELKNVIEHAMILSKDKSLRVQLPRPGSLETDATQDLQDMERRHIQAVLEKTGWRLSGDGGAAEALGLKRTTLHAKMKKLGIKRPNK